MGLAERMAADLLGTGITVGPHPMLLYRKELAARRVRRAIDLETLPDGTYVSYAVETLPPFLLMGVRSLLAGLCLTSGRGCAGREALRERTGGPPRAWGSSCSSGAMAPWPGRSSACRLASRPSAWPRSRFG